MVRYSDKSQVESNCRTSLFYYRVREVGIRNWTSTIHLEGDLIVFKVQDQNTERKQWFAELTELDDVYQFKRDFITYADAGESDSGHFRERDDR